MKKLFMMGIMLLISVTVNFQFMTKKTFADEGDIASPNEVQKALVCLLGHDYSQYLNYDGYEIVDNPVNFSICNQYRVKYQRGSDIYYKIVEVVNRETLYELGYYQFNYVDFLPKSNYGTYLLTQTFYEDINYLIYGFYDVNERSKSDELYLIAIKNDEIVMEKYLYSTKEKTPKKIIVNENSIIILGQTSNNNGNIYIENYNTDGTLKCQNELIGENNDILTDAVIIDNYLYISGVTNSSDHYYLGTRKGMDGFIMRLVLDTLVFNRATFLSEEGYDIITNICTINGDLFFIHQSTISNKPYTQLMQMSAELGLKKNTTISTELDYTIKKLVEKDGYIYILNTCYSSNYTRDIGRLSIFNASMRKVKDIIYSDEEFKDIDDIMVVNKNEFSVLLTTKNQNNELSFANIKYLNMEETLRISKKYPDYTDSSYAGVSGDKLYTHKNNRLVRLDITNIKIDSFGTFNDDVLKNYRVMINYQEESINLDKSQLFYDERVYGNYQLICAFSSRSLDLVYYLDYVVVEDFNVKIDEIYDVGYELKFNGVGYLNGVLVENGYIINQNGNYTLEVYGNNKIKREINFKISKYELEYKVEKETTLEINEEDYIKNNYEQKVNYQVFDNTDNKITYPTKNNWLIIFPLFSAVAVAFIIIRFH